MPAGQLATLLCLQQGHMQRALVAAPLLVPLPSLGTCTHLDKVDACVHVDMLVDGNLQNR
jgi:hypothetical protein